MQIQVGIASAHRGSVLMCCTRCTHSGRQEDIMQLQKLKNKIDFRFNHRGTLVEAVTQSHGRKEKKKTQDACFSLETAKICGSEGLGDLEDIYGFKRSEK